MNSLDRLLRLTFTDYGPGGGNHVQGILDKWCQGTRRPWEALRQKSDRLRFGIGLRLVREIEYEVVLNMDPHSSAVAHMLGELDLAGAAYRFEVVQVGIDQVGIDKPIDRPTIWERLTHDGISDDDGSCS